MNKNNRYTTIFQIFGTFLDSLNDEQIKMLLLQKAKIQYVSNESSDQIDYNNLFYQLKDMDSYDEKDKLINSVLKTREDMLALCKYYNIPSNTKTIKSELVERIIQYANSNLKEIPDDYQIQELAQKLETFNDTESARQYFYGLPQLKSKNSLIKLAKHFDVYISKETNSQFIIDMIIEAVVGAKLLSQHIHKSLTGEIE